MPCLTFPMIPFILAALLGIVGPLQAQQILEVDGRIPTSAVLTVGPSLPEGDLIRSEMGFVLTGVLRELGRREMAQLARAIPLNPQPVTELADPVRICVVHLTGHDRTKRVEIVETIDGELIAIELDWAGEMPLKARLRADRFRDLMEGWPLYRAGFDPSLRLPEPGDAVAVDRPLTPSPIFLDESTCRERLYRGLDVTFEPASRVLNEEKMFIRLPRGHDARRPSGLVVWIDPTPSGLPPRVFDEALDELGMICIGTADSGNDRHLHDRMQLALDGVATASTNYLIDDRRVYVAGMSGGGRTASMLWCTFPDIFAGGLPIVGVNCYRNIPAGGGKVWLASHAKPDRELLDLLRTRRLAPITGPSDYNHENTMGAVRIFLRDRLTVRAFSFESMGHEMPTPDGFAEALRWVDEPYRAMREQEIVDATYLLEQYRQRFDAAQATAPEHRELLTRITEVAPWSEPAWEAMTLLGVEIETRKAP